MDRNGQHVPNPQPGMWFPGGLAVDPDRTLRDKIGAVGTRAKNAGTPQPFVESLPVLILDVGYRRPPLRRTAKAANGPLAGFADGAPGIAAGRRRRSGISIGGAGGPC
jgi:hypothetical protein